MIFDNNTISLKGKDNKLYKIYFCSKKYKIVFPKELKIKELFNDYSCTYEFSKKRYCCKDYFNGKNINQ